MHKIFRVLKSIFLSHSVSVAEAGFIRGNTSQWTSSTGRPGILVETALSTPASLLEKFLIAKLIEKKTGTSSIVVLNSLFEKSSEAFEVARSFGMSHFFCWWRGYFNPSLLVRSLVEACSIIKKGKTGLALLAYSINGVHIGDLIYDTLIRYRPNCYTVNQLCLKNHFRLIFRAIYNFHRSSQLFSSHSIRAVVTSHTVYAEFGILCRIAHANGAAVFLKDMDVFRVYGENDNIYEHFLKVSANELEEAMADPNKVRLAEAYFENRLGGRIDQVDLKNAYSDKKIYTKDALFKCFNLDNELKNVFVMAHAFSDAPHVGGKLAFADYYVWLKEALLELSKNKSVNVFVKPHPSSYMWGERGAVETLLEEIGITNIHIAPLDMNTLSIRGIADYVVTARGTAGLEYSGFGMPAIICGEGYYSGFGIAHEASSGVAFCELLANITEILPLEAHISLKARVLLYLTFTKLARSSVSPERHIYPGDDIQRLIPEHFDEMKEKLRKKGSYRDDFYATVDRAVSNAF